MPLVTLSHRGWFLFNSWRDGREVWYIQAPDHVVQPRPYSTPEGARRAINRRIAKGA